MLTRLLGYEFFVETVPVSKKFVDWYNSINENHFWFGPLHVVWNRIGELHGNNRTEGP